MRAIESVNRFHVYLQRLSTQFWKGIMMQKGCCLCGALAITAALVVYVVKNYRFSSAILLGVAAVAVFVPCTKHGCSWFGRRFIRWHHNRRANRLDAAKVRLGPPFTLGIHTDYIIDHRIFNNNLLCLTINRSNMNFAAVKEYLKVLAKYLRCYGDWENFSLNIGYEGERAIDAGGLSREFITQLFRNLFHFPDEFPFFRQNESGQCDLFDGMLTMNIQDLQVCKDIGTFLAAGFTGFPRYSDAKIGNVFSDKFYNFLLNIHKYTVDHPDRVNHSFNAMSQEDKEMLVLQLANHDLENPSYKEINSCLQKLIEVEETDKELDVFFKFIIDLSFVEDVDPKLSPALKEIVEAFRTGPNYVRILNASDPFTLIGNEGQRYTQDVIRETLRAALIDEQQKIHFQKKFARSLVDAYQNTCIPLMAVEQGFRSVGIRRIMPFIDQLKVDPHSTIRALSIAIQGPSFTREAFIALLRRSTAVRSIQEKVNWIIEWCERGIDQREETRATEEAMKNMLSCMTRTEVITNTLVVGFYLPVPGYSQFHTCDYSINFGISLMVQTDKTTFIQMWNEQVSRAHLEGFSMA